MAAGLKLMWYGSLTLAHRGTAHDQSHGNLVNDSPRHDTNMSSDNLVVPIPQRISSLLRLGEMLNKTPPTYDRSTDRTTLESLPLTKPESVMALVSRRVSSLRLKENTSQHQHTPSKRSLVPSRTDTWRLNGVTNDELVDVPIQENTPSEVDNKKSRPNRGLRKAMTEPVGPTEDIELQEREPGARDSQRPGISLRGRSHVSLRGYQAFSLTRSHRRQPIARDWSAVRKRFVAAVACISTALIGILVGIYAGLVPSIQYWIADLSHYAILGNVFFYIGLAIPSFFFWPLPLLHGRKPYILSSLVLAMPLLFPQAIAVSEHRSPYVSTWR